MNLKIASIKVLDQLLDLLNQIKTEDYKINMLALNASIGQHARHILEFYICLFRGLETGIINYDDRDRDVRIENDKALTIDIIKELKEKINSLNNYPDVILQVEYGDESAKSIQLQSNIKRELVYNIEHTIHHLAIIKHSIIEHLKYIDLPDHFGIASSTTRYMKQQKG
jgi:hypothetical protein